MTVRAITDPDGALWPVTGWWCEGCGMPLYRDDPSGLHPGCRETAPLTDTEHDRLTAALGDLLGAVPVAPVQIGTWRVSGEPLYLRQSGEAAP